MAAPGTPSHSPSLSAGPCCRLHCPLAARILQKENKAQLQHGVSFLYNFSLAVMAFAGVLFSPFFFAGHLLMIVNKSVMLHIVMRSVLVNGWSLLLTALLTLVVVYLFIIFGYVFFTEDFVGSPDTPGVCSSLLECFQFGLLNGLRAGGGLGDLLPHRCEQPIRHMMR